MRKIHISDIPYKIANNVDFFRVPIRKECSPCLPSTNLGATIISPPKIEVKTYRVIRGNKYAGNK